MTLNAVYTLFSCIGQTERVLVIMNAVVFGQTDKCTGMRDEENKSCWTHLLFVLFVLMW